MEQPLWPRCHRKDRNIPPVAAFIFAAPRVLTAACPPPHTPTHTPPDATPGGGVYLTMRWVQDGWQALDGWLWARRTGGRSQGSAAEVGAGAGWEGLGTALGVGVVIVFFVLFVHAWWFRCVVLHLYFLCHLRCAPQQLFFQNYVAFEARRLTERKILPLLFYGSDREYLNEISSPNFVFARSITLPPTQNLSGPFTDLCS